MALPAPGYLSNDARTEGEMKTAFEDQRDFIEALLGGKAEGAYVIASGVVTPDQTAAFSVDTQSGAGTDDLDRIATTNFTAGSIIAVHQLADSKDVTLRHLQGGDGQLELIGAANYTLANADVYSILMMVAGSPNKWKEIDRWFGNQHAQFRTFRGFGSVATLNRGTTLAQSPAQVPAVDDIVGRQTIWVPVGAMFQPTSDFAGAPTAILLNGSSYYQYAEFADAADQALSINIGFPKSFSGSTFRFEVYWYTTSSSTNSVVFGMAAAAIEDGGGFGGYGSNVMVTDANNGATLLNVTPESSDVTINFSQGNRKVTTLQLTRFAASQAGDNLTAAVRVFGVKIFFNTNAVNDN